jgi:AraC family transcriptional regulator of adaptative response/methylated-DNA-[protein]-cysteine methyltransferase
VLTLERAKALLQESRPLLEVADTLGLSSGSRLYDHFCAARSGDAGRIQAARGRAGIDHGVHDTPFGQAFVALTPRGCATSRFSMTRPHRRR